MTEAGGVGATGTGGGAIPSDLARELATVRSLLEGQFTITATPRGVLKRLLLPLSRLLTNRLVLAVQTVTQILEGTEGELRATREANADLLRRLAELRERLSDVERAAIEDRIALKGRAGPAASPSAPGTPSPSAPTGGEVLDAAGYVAFEERFRGSRADILRRQRDAVRFVESLKDGEAPLLDLGCGRGEWLEVLRERSIPAFGVDSNLAMVEEATGHGLDVRLGDLLDYLEAVQPGTLGGVSGFHVAEHLPPPLLPRLVAAAFRALAPGGILVMETPNPTNLAVGSGSFYLDPTHLRPVHPLFFQFLAQHLGFVDVHVEAVHPAAEHLLVEAPPDGAATGERSLAALSAAMFGGQDYVLSARRPEATVQAAGGAPLD